MSRNISNTHLASFGDASVSIIHEKQRQKIPLTVIICLTRKSSEQLICCFVCVFKVILRFRIDKSNWSDYYKSIRKCDTYVELLFVSYLEKLRIHYFRHHIPKKNFYINYLFNIICNIIFKYNMYYICVHSTDYNTRIQNYLRLSPHGNYIYRHKL